jgi:TATA-binding protein-associated factor Taf7
MQTGELGVFKVIGKEAIEEGEQAEEEEKAEKEEEEEKEDEEEEEGEEEEEEENGVIQHTFICTCFVTFSSFGVELTQHFPQFVLIVRCRYLSLLQCLIAETLLVLQLEPNRLRFSLPFLSCCARLFFCSHDALT